MRETSHLERVAPFNQLTDEQRSTVAAILERTRVAAGEDIFQQGAPADGMVIVASGRAALFATDASGNQTALAQLHAGEHVNAEALWAEGSQSATLRAAEPTTVFKLERKRLEQLLSERPDLVTALGIPRENRKRVIDPRFAEQRADEEILIATHRHAWAFLRTAWLPLLIMPAMWAGAAAIDVEAAALGLLILSLLLPGAALIYLYLEWRNDSVIVTDQRVIRVNRVMLALFRQVTQVGMESVHEVNFDLPAYDPFARLFRYGTVIVKTAGAQGNLELRHMPKPALFQELVMESRRSFEDRQARRHNHLVRDEMQRWLAGETPPNDAASGAESAGPPRPLRGSKGYLSSRIKMSNGDIVYRKHASVWARHTALPLLIVLASLAALALTFSVAGPDLRVIAFPVSMVALLIGCLAYYWMDWDWRNDIYVISDDTITLVHKRPFFLQNVRDQILVERIDNVESVSSGLFAAILKYGDVRMSLVGADEPKLFRRVSKPQEVQQEISRRQHNRATRRARQDAMRQRQLLGEVLGLSPGAGMAAGTHQPNAAGADADAVTLIRPTVNRDRNRPPRLPRKVLPPPTPPTSAALDNTGRRRPARFR